MIKLGYKVVDPVGRLLAWSAKVYAALQASFLDRIHEPRLSRTHADSRLPMTFRAAGATKRRDQDHEGEPGTSRIESRPCRVATWLGHRDQSVPAQAFTEQAVTDLRTETHEHALTTVFPAITRVTS